MRAGALIAAVALAGCGGDDRNCVDVEMAPNIVQINFLRVEPPDVRGDCKITGKLTRVFAGSLERGADIELNLPCNPDDIMGFAAASVLELHLDRRLNLYSYAPFERLLLSTHALSEATSRPVTPVVEEICENT
jgi:hypothetical protein